MLLKVRKWTFISPAKNYQNSLKRALLRRKKLHWPRLTWPTRYMNISDNVVEGMLMSFASSSLKIRPWKCWSIVIVRSRTITPREGRSFTPVKSPPYLAVHLSVNLHACYRINSLWYDTDTGTHIGPMTRSSAVAENPRDALCHSRSLKIIWNDTVK